MNNERIDMNNCFVKAQALAVDPSFDRETVEGQVEWKEEKGDIDGCRHCGRQRNEEC